jgi:hypothetical protein
MARGFKLGDLGGTRKMQSHWLVNPHDNKYMHNKLDWFIVPD